MTKKAAQEETVTLSARSFILALQGKTVNVQDGNERSFLGKDFFENDEVQIDNVVIIDSVEIDQGDFEYPISINGGDFKGYFGVHGGTFMGDLKIAGGQFKSSFRIVGGVFDKDFEISGGTFDNLIQVDKGKFNGKFDIGNGAFKSAVSINGGAFNREVSINGGVYDRQFTVSGGVFDQQFTISGGQFKLGLKINGGFFRTFSVSDSDYLKALTLAGGQFEKVVVNSKKDTINHLKVLETLNLSFPVIIGGSINKLLLQGRIHPKGSVYIETLKVRFLLLSNFINGGVLDINRLESSIQGRGFISVKNSDLGNAIFKEADFRSFQTIHVSNSRLHNITTIGGYFPSHLDIGSTQNKPSDPERSAEAYNQLTLAMQRQGNRDKEVEYYTSYLDWQRKAYLRSKKWSAAGSLWLHKVSTEYGSSWLRGALGTFFVGAVFYFLFLLSLPEVSCCSLQNGWTNFSTNVGYFFAFLLPTHGIHFIDGTSLTPFSYIFDFFGRIATGFLIYQTIAAFRRYGKV